MRSLDFKKHLDAKGCNGVLKNHISKPHNCLYYESMFSNQSDLNSHTKNQHEKQLKHCGSCEMKVESDTEASKHTEKAHRWESPSCYKYDYETDGPTKLEVHALLLHGIVDCNKCEYAAEDFDIINEHMKKHTGSKKFQCGKCEFEATRQALLDNHIELRIVICQRLLKKIFAIGARNTCMQFHCSKYHWTLKAFGQWSY